MALCCMLLCYFTMLHVTCATWYYVTWYCVTWLSQLSLKPVVSPQTLPAYTPSHPTSFDLRPGGLMSLNLGNLSGFNSLKITQTCCYQCKLRRLSFTKRETLQYFKTVHLWPQPLTPCSHQMTTTRFTISPRLEEPHTASTFTQPVKSNSDYPSKLLKLIEEYPLPFWMRVCDRVNLPWTAVMCRGLLPSLLYKTRKGKQRSYEPATSA